MARVWSKEAARNGPGAGGCCGNVKGSVSGPLPFGSRASPKKLRRAVADAALLLTSVKVLVQFSSAARCAIAPTKFKPLIAGACCSMVKVCPAIEREPLRSPPLLGSTWNVTVALPVPDEALVRTTPAGGVPIVHGQFGSVVMVTVPLPPFDVKASPPKVIVLKSPITVFTGPTVSV